jgi:hypothetical protein
MYRKSIATVVVLLFILSSLIPMVSSDTSNSKSIIYVDDDNIFYDYTDDVFCWYYILAGNNGMYRNDKKHNVNIIRGSYSSKDDNVTLTLEVEGIIEDRGNMSYTSIVNSVFYGFDINTSKNNYQILYCNRSCILEYDNVSQNLSNFEVNGSNISISFSLNNSSEFINSVTVLASDVYFGEKEIKFETNSDLAANIEYSIDIEITKPDKSLYVFNNKICLYQ